MAYGGSGTEKALPCASMLKQKSLQDILTSVGGRLAPPRSLFLSPRCQPASLRLVSPSSLFLPPSLARALSLSRSLPAPFPRARASLSPSLSLSRSRALAPRAGLEETREKWQ
jgi:hypothetical protein